MNADAWAQGEIELRGGGHVSSNAEGEWAPMFAAVADHAVAVAHRFHEDLEDDSEEVPEDDALEGLAA